MRDLRACPHATALLITAIITATGLAFGSTTAASGAGAAERPAGSVGSVGSVGSAPTPGATSVLDPAFGLTGDPGVDGDATAAFAQAAQTASAGSVRYAAGPTGDPQAVVYVPPGTYRLDGWAMPSDLRLEVDAGAVLEPLATPTDHVLTAADPTTMVELGTDDTAPVVNDTITGVDGGQGAGPSAVLKQRAAPVYPGWDLAGSFAVDLDAATNGSPNDMGFAALTDVTGFEISHVLVVQNGTIPKCTVQSSTTCPVGRGSYPWPTTGRAAIVYKPSHRNGVTSAGPFYDPTDGTLADVYSIGAPFGYGPVQVSSGHDIVFDDLYSQGGTTLRLETDDAAAKLYGGEVAGVTADHIVGQNCNRAVSLSAHRQANKDVSLRDVTAVSCNDGLVQDASTKTGVFANTTLDGFTVLGGTTAQVPRKQGIWKIATSVQPVENTVPKRAWSAAVTDFSCRAPFSRLTYNPFVLNGVSQAPVCSAS